MNNKYTIRFEHPLLRPGIVLITESSEKYVLAVLNKGLDLIRQFNDSQQKEKEDKP